MSKNLAFIPARSGSKGVKDKNIRLMCGRPLMSYTIRAALESDCFHTIYVSTDCNEYAEIAKKNGAEVPFLRRSSLSQDDSSVWDAMRYALERYEEEGKHFDTITLLQPTSPLRRACHIVQCFQEFEKQSAEAVISVCEAEPSPLICNTLPDDKNMKHFLTNDILSLPRQQYPKYYCLNGAVYLMKTEVLYDYASIYESDVYAHVMSQDASVDIDTELDFMLAQLILEKDEKE